MKKKKRNRKGDKYIKLYDHESIYFRKKEKFKPSQMSQNLL